MKKLTLSLFLFVVLAACAQETETISINNAPAEAGTLTKVKDTDIHSDYGQAYTHANKMQLFFKEDQSTATFEGDGNEYASYTEQTEWLSEEFVRVTIDNGGTVISSYYALSANAIYALTTVADEAPLTVAQLNTMPRDQLVLQAPIEVGASFGEWHVVMLDQTITTPLNTFTNVIVLESKTAEATNKLYITSRFGVIKKEFITATDTITSTLSSIRFR